MHCLRERVARQATGKALRDFCGSILHRQQGWSHPHVFGYTGAETAPCIFRSTFFLHGVCMLRECIHRQCAHEQHLKRTLTLTHTITAYLVSENVVRVRILICATRQTPCRKRIYRIFHKESHHGISEPHLVLRPGARARKKPKTFLVFRLCFSFFRFSIFLGFLGFNVPRPDTKLWPRNSGRISHTYTLSPSTSFRAMCRL